MPASIPLFPLEGGLLLPRRPIQLTVFEPRYLAMLDDALGGDRMIGIIQPAEAELDAGPPPELHKIGCAGRIVQFAEIGDGRCFLTLMGVARFRLLEELPYATPYRVARGRLCALRRRFHRRRRRVGGRPRLPAHDAQALRRGQRGQGRLGRHQEGVERGAGQRPVDDEPVRPAREAGAARGGRSARARRDAGGDHHDRPRPGDRRGNPASLAL